MRKIISQILTITGWALDAKELYFLAGGAPVISAIATGILYFFLHLPTWLLVIILVGLIIMLFTGLGYLWGWLKKRGKGAKMEVERKNIKDTQIKLDAEKSDKARGLEIIDTPTDLENVQVEVTAKDVKDVSALSITSHDKTPLSVYVIQCECGYFIRYIGACGTKPSITCPKCGKTHEIKP